MVSIPVQCPRCQSTAVIKAGKQANGTQRYQCQNGQCARRIFLLQYQDGAGCPRSAAKWSTWPSTGVALADTARVLRISPTTVIAVLKKSRRASTRQPCVTALSLFTHRPGPGRTRSRSG